MNLIIILGIIGLLALAGWFFNKGSSSGGGRRRIKYNWFEFKNLGMDYGLSKPEIKKLKNIGFESRVSNMNALYSSAKILDQAVINSVKNTELTEMDDGMKSSLIEEIFLIRNKIDLIHLSKQKKLSNTNKLLTGQKINLTFDKIGTYHSQILDTSEVYFAAEFPLEALNLQEFSWKGKKVKVNFSTSGDAEYFFFSKVLDQTPSTSLGLLHISHTNKLVRVQKRLHRRINSNISVDIFILKLSSLGSSKRIVVANPTPFNGVISDISAGGVSIKAGGILKEKTLVKLDFSLDSDYFDSTIGSIVSHTTIPGSADKLLHIKFEKISKKMKNKIFQYIYENRALEEKNKYETKTIIPTQNGTIIPSQNSTTTPSQNQEEYKPFE
ncbi:MAG: PilZ domain-containing protein [Spirochaetes bacterium]|nr:PilZ domain-containing protein [Spirochaetota bacterium]